MPLVGQRIRLNPNNIQATWLTRCAGTGRFAFNWGLARWREQHGAGDKPSWSKINAELNALKATEFPWMHDLPWAVPANAIRDLGNAFTHFFRRVKAGQRPVGYPRFKKKGRARESFAIEGRALRFDGRRVRIPKLGWVRMRQGLRFSGRVVSARFTQRAGHWYLSVQVEVDASRWSYTHACETQAACGVDLGVCDLAVVSDGSRTAAPRALRKHLARLRRLNKELSRRTKGGKNWYKTVSKISKLHERIANIRRDITHKLTTDLVRRYRYIGIEDLNVAAIARTRLAKSVMDAAIGEVARQLAYKAPLAGSTIVQADRFFPSSKTCSTCGNVYRELTLSERTWTCNMCGTAHDRDLNAALNLKAMAAAHAVTACRHGRTGADVTVGVERPSGQEPSYVADRR